MRYEVTALMSAGSFSGLTRLCERNVPAATGKCHSLLQGALLTER
jgi:hypothetical protein